MSASTNWRILLITRGSFSWAGFDEAASKDLIPKKRQPKGSYRRVG
ncbi:MAG: hypothetical protein R3C68_19800 [Myxococcota bacterium]